MSGLSLLRLALRPSSTYLTLRGSLRSLSSAVLQSNLCCYSFRRNLTTDEIRFKEQISLADEVMKAQSEKDEKGGQNESQQQKEDKSGYKPMTKWQKFGYGFFAVSMIGGLLVNGVLFSLPDKDEDGQEVKDEFSDEKWPAQGVKRLKSRIFKTKKDLEEPFSDKLLPDPLPEPYHQPKYTILLELTGLLVHSTWSHKHGWRFQKRPGVDMFLAQVGYPNFELVIYTNEGGGPTFFPIVDGLDPDQQHIIYRLFRDATRYINGHHTKDLSAINRDLSKVIVVDWNDKSVALNSDRDNALILEKWTGDHTDRKLIGLAQLLNAIRTSDVDDVREVLQYYKQFDDPIEAFRENQRKLQVEMEAEDKRKEEQKQKGSLFSGFGGFGSRRV